MIRVLICYSNFIFMIILCFLHLVLPTLYQKASLVYLYLVATSSSSPMELKDYSYLNQSNVIYYFPLEKQALSVFVFSCCLCKGIFNFLLSIDGYFLYPFLFCSQDQFFQIYTFCTIYHLNLRFILVMEIHYVLCFHMDCLC